MEIEAQLSEVLSEFARTLVTNFPIQRILDHLVERIVHVLPVTSAGVTMIAPGAPPRYIAASSESAMRFEQLQTGLGEGPCLAAYLTDTAVAIPDLREDSRFPRFAAAAAEAGLVAVFTFPLRLAERQLGALDLYRLTAGPLDSREMAAAQTLADVATAYIVNAEARAELQDLTARAEHRSLHDNLTGLPNRALLVERLDHAILRSRRSKKKVAILFADLDRFKSVNDTYGHHVGDELLVAVAERLTSLLRPGDTLARMSGDEFIILCEDLDEAAAVEMLASRISDALADPFALPGGTAVMMSASVGIAFAGLGKDVPGQVLKEADAAMYRAKRGGGARHGVVDRAERRLAERSASLSADLEHALARRELTTVYQPIVAAVGGTTVAVEALLRWTHPTHGVILPATVIPLAERSGLINEIGLWVLRQACIDRRRWGEPPAIDGPQISVNVSAHQLATDGFAASVEEILTDTATEAHRVTLEVTESIFMADSHRTKRVLGDLKHVGVRLALDDFGTGFCSLGYLDRVPVDVIKIDRRFVSDLDSTPSHRLIVGAIVGLAHGLGITVVAEGIETAAAYRAVRDLGCDACQGFYFARPGAAADLVLSEAGERA